jgi:hypothetical protein
LDALGNDVTAQVGAISYVSTDTTVATIDATTAVATARRPGRSNIFASIAGVNSPVIPFITCAPELIWIQSANVAPSETSFVLASAATKQLAPSVVDTNSNGITDPGLTWTSSNRGVATVSTNGLVTAVAPGVARIVASCAPNGCNNNTNQPIYSNVVTVTVSGALTPRVYVTGANSTTIVPIEPATNTAGTGVTVPQIAVNGTNTQPVLTNAMFSPDGAQLFIGSNLALFTFNPATNQFTSSNAGAPGRILAVSSSGRVAVADPTGPTVRIYDSASASVIGTVTLSTPVAAAFTPDTAKLFVAGAQGVMVASNSANILIPIGQPVRDIALIGQGSMAYAASGAGLDNFATCDHSLLQAGITPNPRLVVAAEDSSRVFAVNDTSIFEIGINLHTLGCPPTATNSAVPIGFGVGSFTPRQLIVTQAADRAFVLSNLANVLAYDAINNTPAAISLAGGATSALSGGALPDGSQLYVGAAGTNDVHRIDVAAGTDAQQIAVNLKKTDNTATSPDIVVVKPR